MDYKMWFSDPSVWLVRRGSQHHPKNCDCVPEVKVRRRIGACTITFINVVALKPSINLCSFKQLL